MTPAVFHPAAEGELLAAVEYYEAKAVGLGRAFLLEAERTLKLIQQFPEIGPLREGDVRRFAFARFPYSYLYRLPPNAVRVLAVMHHRRSPRATSGRR